jgi:hypothetical protein
MDFSRRRRPHSTFLEMASSIKTQSINPSGNVLKRNFPQLCPYYRIFFVTVLVMFQGN